MHTVLCLLYLAIAQSTQPFAHGLPDRPLFSSFPVSNLLLLSVVRFVFLAGNYCILVFVEEPVDTTLGHKWQKLQKWVYLLWLLPSFARGQCSWISHGKRREDCAFFWLGFTHVSALFVVMPHSPTMSSSIFRGVNLRHEGEAANEPV